MTKVEEVARALLVADDGGNADYIMAATEHRGDCPHVAMPESFTCSKCQADHYRVLARAAIAAMRTPTEAMLEASNREWDGRMSYRSTGAWQAMIDAALAETDPS